MNKDEIKKKVENYKAELISSRECCDTVDLSDEVLYLLSIIEHAEKALESVANAPARETMRRYAEDALKAIRG